MQAISAWMALHLLFLCFLLDANAGNATSWKKNLDELDIHEPPLIAVATDGTICLADTKEQQLVLLDADGNLIKRLGTKGRGPKEFSQIMGVGTLNDGKTFWVADHVNARFTTWNLDGYLAEAAIDTRFNKWDTDSTAVISMDRCYYIKDNYGCKGTAPVVTRVDLTSDLSEDLLALEALKADVGLHIHKGKQNIMGIQAWDGKMVTAYGSDFVVAAYTTEPVVGIHNLKTGALQKNIPVKLSRYPTTSDQFRAIVENEIPSFMREDVVPKIIQPDFWPAIRGIRVDSTDRIWVFGYTAALDDTAPYTIFDQKGNLLGEGVRQKMPSLIRNGFYTVVEDGEGFFQLEKEVLPTLTATGDRHMDKPTD